jgi:hypothetical protein
MMYEDRIEVRAYEIATMEDANAPHLITTMVDVPRSRDRRVETAGSMNAASFRRAEAETGMCNASLATVESSSLALWTISGHPAARISKPHAAGKMRGLKN